MKQARDGGGGDIVNTAFEPAGDSRGMSVRSLEEFAE